ncbi:hypothetical protein LX36DRAFT_657541 [Colletotrichum falcatum]|nr:hypothetical protein LX36DRAFT_657541 [Colletotrichum falcatum]
MMSHLSTSNAALVLGLAAAPHPARHATPASFRAVYRKRRPLAAVDVETGNRNGVGSRRGLERDVSCVKCAG